LLNEGTSVWRPLVVVNLGDDRYRVIGKPSEDEEWAYAPGMVVTIDGNRRIIAEATPNDGQPAACSRCL